MKKTVEEKVTETREHIVAIICDKCGTHIQQNNGIAEEAFFKVSTRADLNSDVYDNADEYHYCSVKCAQEAMTEFFRKYKDTCFFHIEKARW